MPRKKPRTPQERRAAFERRRLRLRRMAIVNSTVHFLRQVFHSPDALQRMTNWCSEHDGLEGCFLQAAKELAPSSKPKGGSSQSQDVHPVEQTPRVIRQPLRRVIGRGCVRKVKAEQPSEQQRVVSKMPKCISLRRVIGRGCVRKVKAEQPSEQQRASSEVPECVSLLHTGVTTRSRARAAANTPLPATQ